VDGGKGLKRSNGLNPRIQHFASFAVRFFARAWGLFARLHDRRRHQRQYRERDHRAPLHRVLLFRRKAADPLLSPAAPEDSEVPSRLKRFGTNRLAMMPNRPPGTLVVRSRCRASQFWDAMNMASATGSRARQVAI